MTNKEYQDKIVRDWIKTINPITTNIHPEIKGYKLLRKYPGSGSREIGDFEPYTTGDFSKYPEIWEPVYHKNIEREKKINQILNESK